MENNYYTNSQCDYDEDICYRCPLAQNMYPYWQKSPCEHFDQENGFHDQENDFYDDIQEEELINNRRSPKDVERVIKIINKEAKNDISELIKIGIDKRLLDYLIKKMVIHIDNNYNRYTGKFDKKLEMAVADLRRSLPWIFEILQVFSASPATIVRLTDKVASISLKNLKPIPPPPPMTRY